MAPVTKAKISAAAKRRYQNPEYKARHSAAVKKACQDPEYRARVSETAKVRWQNPSFRAKMSAAMEPAYQSPERNAKISSAKKEKWQDTAFKDKMKALYREPVQRARRSAVAKLAATRSVSYKGGRSLHPLCGTWELMISRRYNPANVMYANYGSRGIRVYGLWRNSFWAFAQYMGLKPGPEYSIDRINNDGHYVPGNVRWATSKEQANNNRRGKLRRRAIPFRQPLRSDQPRPAWRKPTLWELPDIKPDDLRLASPNEGPKRWQDYAGRMGITSEML